MSWDSLAQSHPWPLKCPPHGAGLSGWHSEDAKKFLRKVIPRQTKGVYVELGSWKGLSMKWFLDTFPHLLGIAVDHWEGSKEHKKDPRYAKSLPTLYATFLGNLWAYKRRLIPLRENTLTGMELIRAHDIRPAVVYVDASHDYLSVSADIAAAIDKFPYAILVGDDWQHGPVRNAVKDASATFGRQIIYGKKTWQLK